MFDFAGHVGNPILSNYLSLAAEIEEQLLSAIQRGKQLDPWYGSYTIE